MSGRLRVARAAAVGLALAASIATSAWAVGPTAESWPHFRGDASQRGLAASTLSDRLVLRWSATTGGPIKSSPVVADGRVHVGSGDGSLHTFDLATGERRWAFATGGPIEAPPMVAQGVVVVGSTDRHVYALDAATGAVRWKAETGDRVLGSATVLPARPGVTTRVIVGSYDGKLRAFELATGRLVWTHATDHYVHGSPAAVVEGDAIQVIVGGCDSTLHVIDGATGRRLGGLDLGAQIGGAVAVHDAHAFVGTYGNEVVGVPVDDPTLLLEAWEYRDRNFPYFSSAAVWPSAGAAGSPDGLVIVGGRDRRVHALDATTGTRRWVHRTRGKVDGSPVIVGADSAASARVLVGSADGRLVLLRATDGARVWSYDVGSAILGTPAVAGGLAIVGADDGVLRAFGPPNVPPMTGDVPARSPTPR